jgi:hypothetical protein
MTSSFEIDYENMPEDQFKHIYIDSILKGDVINGCIPVPAFNRAFFILTELGFKSVEIERIINDPETILTYVVSSTR